MEKEILTEEIAKKLMEIKGETRGVVFEIDREYILKEEGEEGLKKLEDELERLGYPIKYKEMKAMGFHPIGLRAISLLAIKKVFNFDDEKIKELGTFGSKVSFILKLFIRYFLSAQRVFFEEAPKIWKKHYAIGELVPVELSEEKKYAILRLENFNLHPIFCCFLGGYFCGVVQMLVRSSQITFEETKCTFRGDEYHEYLLKWE
ncbi:hypothetical protein KJA15_03445 [Patescibacteria group bacterium]|nr:hypothetical protein [Patescibacteria group bacterium]